MSVSYKEASELLSALQEIEIPEKTSPVFPLAESTDNFQPAHFLAESKINNSTLSLDSCDAGELMHCYQLAIEFGVPTARRALELYQSRSSIEKEN